MTVAMGRHETDEVAVACYLLVLIDHNLGSCMILYEVAVACYLLGLIDHSSGPCMIL